MWNRPRILVAIVLGAAAMGAVFFLAPPREPHYQGHPLSYWVEELYPRQRHDPRESEQTLKSLRLDTNAIPYLLKWMQCDWEKHNVLEIAITLADAMLGRPLDVNFADKKFVMAYGAARAFKNLGPQAAPAIPELERMFIASADQRHAMSPVALVNLGELGLPVLQRALTNPVPKVRAAAAEHLQLSTNASPAIPQLFELLFDPEKRVAEMACRTLKELKVSPNWVVPRLVQRLSDSSAESRRCAAISLDWWSAYKETKSAVPALQATLNDEDAEVRRCARKALQAIAPEGLTNRSPHEVSF